MAVLAYLVLHVLSAADGRSEHSQDDGASNMDGVSMGDSEVCNMSPQGVPQVGRLDSRA